MFASTFDYNLTVILLAFSFCCWAVWSMAKGVAGSDFGKGFAKGFFDGLKK
jgi:hypothetical protein